MAKKDNVLHLKLINGSGEKKENNDASVFTDGITYGQYLLICQLIEEFEKNQMLDRCKQLFREMLLDTENNPVAFDKEIKGKLRKIKLTVKKRSINEKG